MRQLSRVASGLVLLVSMGAFAFVPYRDYSNRFVPKAPDRRRVALAIHVERNAVDSGSYEIRILRGMLLADLLDRSTMQFLPRVFFQPGDDLMATLRAFEVDDLLDLRIARMKAPRVLAPSEAKGKTRKYKLKGTLDLVNVMGGNTVLSTTLDKVLLPAMSSYADDEDGKAGSLAAIAKFVAGFYERNLEAVKVTPQASAPAAAEVAEKSRNYKDAALILSEIMKRDPAHADEYRDRRDLAMLRSGRREAPAATPEATLVGAAPRGRVDFLDPANRGKLFPVSQGHVPVRSQIRTQAFEFSVKVLAKDPKTKGGILVGSKTKSIYIGITPGNNRPQLFVDSQNTVTGRIDSRVHPLPAGSFPLHRLIKLAVRYDSGQLSVYVGGKRVVNLGRVNLRQTALFLFGKLSTVYFQDAALTQ